MIVYRDETSYYTYVEQRGCSKTSLSTMLKFEIEQLKFVMKENLNWLRVNQITRTKSCIYYVFMQESPPKLESHPKYHGLHECWQN